jgi:CheY-like chemotaxis protein
VVDDNIVNPRLAQVMLEKKGHQVTVAGNGVPVSALRLPKMAGHPEMFRIGAIEKY